MLDWLGSVQVRRRTSTRVELGLTRATAWAGWTIVGVGVALLMLPALWARILGGLCVAFGALTGTLERTLIFDRDEGLLRSEQRILGVRRRAAIPLFHLRAVVIEARKGRVYVAHVERRVGGTIHLDEMRRLAPLLKLAEAVAEVAELRLVYDATTRSAAVD